MKKENKKIKKIAVFRALNLGDMLCAVPALRAIRKNYPKAQIALIGLPWARDFSMRFDKYIDNFIEFPGYPGLPEREVDWMALKNFIPFIKQQKFDLFFQMHGDGTVINPLIKSIGGNIISFYKKGGKKPSFAKSIIYPDNLHEIQRCLKLATSVTGKKESENLEFNIMEHEAKFMTLISTFNKINKNFVAIHPGGSRVEKWLDVKTLSVAGDFLARLGYQIVLTGTASEKLLCEKIAKRMQRKAVNIAGATTVGVMAEIIRRSKLFISNDTGVAHIASALETPYVVIFNVYSDPNRWAPLRNTLTKIVMPEDSKDSEKIISSALALLGPKHKSTRRIYGAT